MQATAVNQIIYLVPQGDAEGIGEPIVVDRTPFRVGRKPENDAQIPRPEVSGVHAEFRFVENAWWLFDINSLNGTFVNGQRISEPSRPKIGDIVHFATQGYQIVLPSEREEISTTTICAPPKDIAGVVELHKILNDRRTYPYFQPLVELTTRRTVGWEALGRANDSSGQKGAGMLFQWAMATKAESKLSAQFRESARHCATCRYCWNVPSGAFLFFNLHPAEIHQEGFMESLIEFGTSNLQQWYRVVLEMPESWVCNTQEMQGLVKQIRELGVLVAYDDFGTGQSRLEEMITVPPDFLKLDRQLIASLGSNPVKTKLVKAIVEACRELKVVTLGEGIETEEEMRACIDMGIELGQGYLLCRPFAAYDLFTMDSSTLPDHCPFVRLDLLR